MRTLPTILAAAATLAALAAGSVADARPHRLVVLDFEGPRELADASRTEIVKQLVLGNYDFVSPKRWEQAKSHSRRSKAAAAKAMGVDAVVEGWVDPDGHSTHVLTVLVSDAATGKELDAFDERLPDKGQISSAMSRDMAEKLDDIMDAFDDERDDERARTCPCRRAEED